MYLPAYKCTNVYWIKDIMRGKKKAIKTSEVKYLYAPQYDSLSISKLLDFAAAYQAIEDYLPEARDIPMLPRQWILNVCFTIIGADFGDLVRGQVDNRHSKLAERQDMNVEVDPAILAVIRTSSAVSTTKGNSAHLLKVGSKRRRTRAEIE